MQRAYELLADATIIRRFDKTRFPANGLAGGNPGARSRFVIRLGGDQEQDTRASGRYDMKSGERFLIQTAGGGGYGDPHRRDRVAVATDVAEGFVTREGAIRDYATN